MVETGPDGAPRRLRGYVGLTPDGGKLIGFARGLTESDRPGYATYKSADRPAHRPRHWRRRHLLKKGLWGRGDALWRFSMEEGRGEEEWWNECKHRGDPDL